MSLLCVLSVCYIGHEGKRLRYQILKTDVWLLAELKAFKHICFELRKVYLNILYFETKTMYKTFF